jgi:hypothetical protein
MSNDLTTISANTPVLEGKDNLESRFSRAWYGFFVTVLRKVKILNGDSTLSATAGTAAALPALPAGYMTITDLNGTARKVPYYNP